MPPALFGLLQLAGAIAAAVGVHLLLGLAWALVIVGGVTLVVATVLEAFALPRPVERELRKVA